MRSMTTIRMRVLALLFLLVAPSSSYAVIGCLTPDDELEAAIPKSTIIAVGTIQECHEVEAGINQLTLRIDELLKGHSPATISISGTTVPCGGFGPGVCDDTNLDFSPGVHVLLFIRSGIGP